MAYNIPDVDNGRFSLNAGESLLQHHDNVQLGLSGDNLPQFLKESKKGKIHLTTQRVIFVVTKSTGGMKSFSMPFYYMKEVEVKQPIFGANALTGDIVAQPNGGWEGKAKFRFDFNSGGAVEFSTTLLRVATKAPKGPPPAPGQAPPAPKNYQTGFYPAPMPNGGAPYGYPTAPPAGGYPPAPPAGGYPPAPGGYPPAPGGYPPQPAMAPPAGYGAPDPAYPPPAYSEAVAGAGVAPSAPPASVYTKLTTTKLGFEPSQQAYLVNSPPCICNTYFGNPYYKPCNHIRSFPPTYGNPYRKGVYTNTFKTVFGNPYTPTDPRYIQPGGNAYYDPNIPQQAYIPQTQPPAYSEKPKME